MIEGKNKQIYFESSVYKQLNIEVIGSKCVIDNSMREQDTFTLTETLNDGTELKFGSCLPNRISFTAHDIPAGLIGKNLRPVEILEGNENEPFTYGEYKIYSDTPTADRTKRQIVAYDAMYDIINSNVKSWYDGLSFPMTLKAFRDSFFAHLGIEQKETSLVNDSMMVNKTLVTTQSDDSSVTAEATIGGKTIIEAICEINGAFGNIGRDGKFEYVILKAITSALYPAEDLYPREDLFPSDANTESMTGHYITFDYEAFQSQAITQLEIRADDSTAGAIVGTSGNNYVISGNFLISDKTGAEMKQIANNLLPVIAQAEYTPIKSCTCVGNPCLELGDPIRFNTSREIVETYILQRTLTGVQSKRDSIVSQGVENHSKNTNSMRETLANVQRRTSTLERNADHLLAQFNDLDENTSSQLEMTASQIQAEVMARLNSEAEMSTRISQSAHSIGLTASGGDQSVGLTIRLYDENGNVIDTSSDNANITVTGFVSFWDLANAGSTTINGANITTGEISCDRLKGGTINGQRFFQTGKYGDLVIDNGIIFVPDTGGILIGQDEVATRDWVYDSAVANAARTAQEAEHAAKAGEASHSTVATNAEYLRGSSAYVTMSGNDNFIPSSNSVWCGTTPNPFAGGYSKGGWKTTSDRRKKKDFSELLNDARYENFFKQLRPMEYRFVDDSNGIHIGFVAQDVEEALIASGIGNDELFALEHSYFTRYDFGSDEEWNNFLISNNGASDIYVLCYQEFIALNTAMIQKQMIDMEFIKCDNFVLHGEITILNQRVQELEEKLC